MILAASLPNFKARTIAYCFSHDRRRRHLRLPRTSQPATQSFDIRGQRSSTDTQVLTARVVVEGR
jgi:hypothetical protein